MTGALRATLIAALLPACDDGFVDLTGIYAVDTDVASEPCGVDQPVAQPLPYVALAESTTLSGFSMRRCSDAAATSCAGDTILDAFPEPTDTGWIGYVYGASGSPCLLVYQRQVARLAGDQLTIDIEQHTDEASPSECSVSYARLYNAAMPCMKHERIEATRR